MAYRRVPIGDSESTSCPVCFCQSEKQSLAYYYDGGGLSTPFQHITCPRCGRFEIDEIVSRYAIDETGSFGKNGSRERADLSAFIRERQRERGEPLFLSRDFLDPAKHDPLGDEFRATPPWSFTKCADKLLKALAAETPGAGRPVLVGQELLNWLAKAWALDDTEFFSIARYLKSLGRVDQPDTYTLNTFSMTILPAGWQRLEELEKEGPELAQGFVAMWFDEELNRLYDEALAPAIRAAGYAPLRIDQHHGEERIDHRIEVQIKQSRFVVADFTGHRGGVYFEAGFARALGRPVFFTCHDDHFKDRHFDITQFACLSWEWNEASLKKLKNDLRFSIENICGRGPLMNAGE